MAYAIELTTSNGPVSFNTANIAEFWGLAEGSMWYLKGYRSAFLRINDPGHAVYVRESYQDFKLKMKPTGMGV
jgi:hypothetical protein